MPKVKCGKCQAVINLDAVPADGAVKCTACGATFRVRTRAAEGPVAKPPSPPPTAPPNIGLDTASPPTPPAPGAAPDFGFLGGASSPPPSAAKPKPPAKTPAVSFDFVQKEPAAKDSPDVQPSAASKPGGTKPKRKPVKISPPTSKATIETAERPAVETKKPAAPVLPPDPPQFQPPSDTPPAPSAGPYSSPAPEIAALTTGPGANLGNELLALPAPSFMTGMFDGSFRYFLTPRIVKVFWILALVAAGIGLTLTIGGYLLAVYGILVADIGLPDGQRYALQFNYQPPRQSQGMGATGKTSAFLFVTFNMLLVSTMILMWLLFLRMILEAFCVLFGIRVSVRTMAEKT